MKMTNVTNGLMAVAVSAMMFSCGGEPTGPDAGVGIVEQEAATFCNAPFMTLCFPWSVDPCPEACPNGDGHCPEYDSRAVAQCSDPAEHRWPATCPVMVALYGQDVGGCDVLGTPCWPHVCVTGPQP